MHFLHKNHAQQTCVDIFVCIIERITTMVMCVMFYQLFLSKQQNWKYKDKEAYMICTYDIFVYFFVSLSFAFQIESFNNEFLNFV